MKRTLFHVAFWFAVATTVAAAEPDADLQRLATDGTLKEFAEVISGGDDSNWPVIHSKEVDPDPLKEALVARLLVEILQADTTKPEEVVPVMTAIAGPLKEAGGFRNLVIADAAERIAVVSLIRAVVKGRIDLEKAERLMERFPVAFPPSERWVELFEVETESGQEAGVLLDTRPVDFLQTVYELTETDFVRVTAGIGGKEVSTTSMTNQRDIAALAFLMATTDTFRNSHLEGLVYFLRSGGNIEGINEADVRKEMEILHKALGGFGSPLMGIHRLKTGQLTFLWEDVTGLDSESRLLVGYE